VPRQKERLFELHSTDPVTFSAERMAAMLSFPADHLRAILFLQQDQAEREAKSAPAPADDEPASSAKARARQLHGELSELAQAYDAQFDPLLSRKQVRGATHAAGTAERETQRLSGRRAARGCDARAAGSARGRGWEAGGFGARATRRRASPLAGQLALTLPPSYPSHHTPRSYPPARVRAQIEQQLAVGARALRNPSLSSAEVVARVYGRQAATDPHQGNVEGAELSAALLPYVEWEQRAHHFGRTAPHRLRAHAESSLLRGGGSADAAHHPYAEVAEPIAGAQPAYKAAVLSQLRKLDSYAQTERRALAAVNRLHALTSGEPTADADADADEPAAAAAHGAAEASFEHPGLSEAELVEMLAADAVRYRLPELLSPHVAQLLFDAQYFAAEFDLGPDEPRPAAAAVAALRGERGDGGGFVTLPAAVAPFTTLVQTARRTPAFRFVDDLGVDAEYLSKRELETLRRRAARASAGDEVGFDEHAAARTIARNRQRRFQGKRQGEYVVIDTTAQPGSARRGQRGQPSGRVHVHERGAIRAGTADEVTEARGYLGFGRRRANRLRFS
jgi:hypothetical protein